jgi:3-oxoacyl-[acyl-carrier protein] reductase
MEVGRVAKGVAVVTGVAGGICSRIAELLIDDGFTVVGLDRSDVPPRSSGLAGYRNVDISNSAELNAAMDEIVTEFGGLDAVIAGAGVASQKKLLEVSEEELERVLSINVIGTFFTVQAAYRHFAQNGRGGRIVVISSLAASVGGVFAGPHYSASKAAVEGLVRAVAKEGARQQILINAVAPGVTATPMTTEFGYSDDQFPLGRVAQPDDIAGAAIFLCSDSARYITGITMHVNGGMYFG